MQGYSTEPVQDKPPLCTPRRRRRWSERARLRHTWSGNPFASTCAWSKRRWRMETELARFFRDQEAIVAGLRRVADQSPHRAELAEQAAYLSLVTPESLGVLRVQHAGRPSSKRQLPFYIPADAMSAVSAVLGLVRTVLRELGDLARSVFIEGLRAGRKLLDAIFRDRHLPQAVPPHTHRPEVSSLSRGNSGSSAPSEPAWLQGVKARRCVAGGGEVA